MQPLTNEECWCLLQDFEGGFAAVAVPEDGKVGVEGNDARDAEPLHERERCTVHERKILVGKPFADGPRGFEVADAGDVPAQARLPPDTQIAARQGQGGEASSYPCAPSVAPRSKGAGHAAVIRGRGDWCRWGDGD